METGFSKFIKIILFGCLSDYGRALLVTALVRTRMPGGVGGRGAKPLPIPLIHQSELPTARTRAKALREIKIWNGRMALRYIWPPILFVCTHVAKNTLPF